MIQEKVNAIYDDVTRPLGNFTSNYSKGSLLRMKEYMTVLGSVMDDFAVKANQTEKDLVIEFPEKTGEIRAALREVKNRIVSNYKPG